MTIPKNEIIWKRRPSEIRGYSRTLYTTLNNRDYLRADYNIKEKRVRLYVEIAQEGGSSYFSVIVNGKISVEKSVLSGRTRGVPEKFLERAESFSTIQNKDVLRLINANYDIGKIPIDFTEQKKVEHEKNLKETKKKYFKTEENPYIKSRQANSNSSKERHSFKFHDLIDFFLGIGGTGAIFYFFNFDYVKAGVFAAFFSIVSSLFDVFIRDRSPIFTKMIFFMVGGALLYIYGYYFF